MTLQTSLQDQAIDICGQAYSIMNKMYHKMFKFEYYDKDHEQINMWS
jgi:hypothetical protein